MLTLQVAQHRALSRFPFSPVVHSRNDPEQLQVAVADNTSLEQAAVHNSLAEGSYSWAGDHNNRRLPAEMVGWRHKDQHHSAVACKRSGDTSVERPLKGGSQSMTRSMASLWGSHICSPLFSCLEGYTRLDL